MENAVFTQNIVQSVNSSRWALLLPMSWFILGSEALNYTEYWVVRPDLHWTMSV